MTYPSDGSTPPVTVDAPTPEIPDGVNIPTEGLGGTTATTSDVTKWDTDVIESFAAEMDRLAEVFTAISARAPEVVSTLTGGAAIEDIPPVYQLTVKGLEQTLGVVCTKAKTLSSSLVRDAAVLRAFAKDARETDDINTTNINNVDGQV